MTGRSTGRKPVTARVIDRSGVVSSSVLRLLLIRLAINTVALWVAIELIPRAEFEGRIINLILVALLFGLVNSFIRPFVKLLTLPLTVVTLGLFSLVVNGLMLLLTAQLSDSLNFSGSFLQQLLAAVIGTIVISLVSAVLSVLVAGDD
jgi:putative membrane protein